MKLNYLLIANAIISLVNATGAIIFTSLVLKMYGVTQGQGELLMAQFAGIGSVAIGLLAIFTLKMNRSEEMKFILLALFISDLAGVVISVLGTLKGVMNQSGWSLAAIYMVFVLGYGYFLFVKQNYFVSS